jgi:hypothetical protein
MYKVLFYTNHVCLRGSSVAIRDYARYLPEFYGLDTIVAFNPRDHRNNVDTIRRWEKLFPLYPCMPADLNRFIEDHGISTVYQMTSTLERIYIENAQSLIHQTGMISKPDYLYDNEVYAYVSEWSARHNQSHTPSPDNWVPHIVTANSSGVSRERFRNLFDIPHNATVIGRTGGLDTWNMSYTDECITRALRHRGDLWFVLQNTPIRIRHQRVIYLPPTSSERIKSSFIRACDAMIHARAEGESFGIACGEFSVHNKPVITFSGSPERSHLEILGDNAILFDSPQTLLKHLVDYRYKDRDWNCYKSFSPEIVIPRFAKVFRLPLC